MTLISDSNGILRSQETKSFLDRFQKSINTRLTCMEGKEALTLLYDIRDNLLAEESAVNRTVREIEALLERLQAADNNEALQSIAASFHELAAEQFRSRASVSTFHAHYSRFIESLVCHAVATATAMLKSEGADLEESSWCALATGELGRGETSRRRPGQILLLAEETPGFPRELFNQLAYRTLAIIEPLLPPEEKRAAAGRRRFWSGTTGEWQQLVATGLQDGKSLKDSADTFDDEGLFAETIAMVADLKPICGSMALAEAVVASSRSRVAATVGSDRFRQFAKQTTAMPVAIGIFGRFKTVRSGKHRGEFYLEELAIKPLVASIRILAVAYGIAETETIARIRAILATGNLGVTFADRLLHAYHGFMTLLIESELTAGNATGQVYFNPEAHDELTRENLRIGLEEVTTLQRLAYQQLVEVD